LGQLGLRIVNVVLFSLGSYQVAGVVSHVAEDRLTPDYYGYAQEEVDQTAQKQTWNERKAILDRNLFGAQVAVVKMPTKNSKRSKPAPPPPKQVQVVETKLPLKLLGTMAAEPMSLSTAVIQDTQARKHTVVMVGDTIKGHETATVISIEPGRVLIENGNKQEELLLQEAKNPSLAGRAAPAIESNADRSRRRVPRNARSRRQEVSRRSIESRKEQRQKNSGADANMAARAQEILTDAGILPAYDDEGNMDGFSVNSVEPESFLAEVGLQNEDVIQNINGLEIDTPAATTKVFSTIRSGEALTITGQRDGAPISFEVSAADVQRMLSEQ
jgi:type II secretion system protein C